jgi:hypothetical protein
LRRGEIIDQPLVVRRPPRGHVRQTGSTKTTTTNRNNDL